MVTEPQPYEPRALPPPQVADRRSPDRRSRERRQDDRPQVAARTAVAAAMAFCGGLVVVFVFFWALGAIDVKVAVTATIVTIVLLLVWLAGVVQRGRQEETLLIRRDRERRGF
jgi:Flp pilus assembly protein TadB